KSVLAIELPDKLGVSCDPVRIVDIAGLEKGKPAGLGGMNDRLQSVLGKGAIAGKKDTPDAGLEAFMDLEDEVCAPLTPPDHLCRDLSAVSPLPLVHLDDPRGVRLHCGHGHWCIGLKPGCLREIGILEQPVAFKLQAPDHRCLDDAHDHMAVGMNDPDV